MSPQDLEVVMQAAPWILAEDPEAGVEAFLHMRPPLPPRVVLPILQVRGWVSGHGGFLFCLQGF
jgi:hypothetical protein